MSLENKILDLLMSKDESNLLLGLTLSQSHFGDLYTLGLVFTVLDKLYEEKYKHELSFRFNAMSRIGFDIPIYDFQLALTKENIYLVNNVKRSKCLLVKHNEKTLNLLEHSIKLNRNFELYSITKEEINANKIIEWMKK